MQEVGHKAGSWTSTRGPGAGSTLQANCALSSASAGKTCCNPALALPVSGSQETPCNPGAILEGQLAVARPLAPSQSHGGEQRHGAQVRRHSCTFSVLSKARGAEEVANVHVPRAAVVRGCISSEAAPCSRLPLYFAYLARPSFFSTRARRTSDLLARPPSL